MENLEMTTSTNAAATASGAAHRTVPDLDTRSEIHDLVVYFYREIVFDEFLDHVFEDVAQVDWNVHIPRLIDYWCGVLLRQPGYDGMVLASHHDVHDLEEFTPEHFETWFAMWVRCVNERWQGPLAERAKSHAAHMVRVMSRKLLGSEWDPVVVPGWIDDATASDSRNP